MARPAFWLAVIAVTLISQHGFARDCSFVEGEDRWTIKTSVPNGALDQTAEDISLESLIDSQNPQISAKQKAAIADRRWSGRVSVSDSNGDDVSLREGDMISVEGFLYRARCQKDGDYHLEIGTSDKKSSPCLIVEAPDPDEIADAALKERVLQVRRTLDTLDPGIFSGRGKPVSVKITGQFFLDAHHIGKGEPGGNRGTNHCATNIWEIHPVTALEVR